MAGGVLIPLYTTPVLDSSGNPNSGATLTVYNAGTTTPASLFIQSSLTTPLTNPLTSDAAGRFVQNGTLIWADSAQNYDLSLGLTDGTSITFNNMPVITNAQSAGDYLSNPSPALEGVPTAPTPAITDDSNTIPTTQFVVQLVNSKIAAIPQYVPPTSISDKYSPGTSGYYWHSSGWLEQWGIVNGSYGQGPVAVSFPVAFDAPAENIVFTQYDSGAGVSSWINYTTLTPTGCTAYVKRGAGDNNQVSAFLFKATGPKATSP